MKNQVKVTAKEGAVVIASTNNAEYGYIRVESEQTNFVDGWVRTEKRSALIKGKTADLNALGFTEGKVLPGKIVIKESTLAPYAGAQPKINPSTGEICKSVDGLAIYRDSIYTTNMSAEDILVQKAKTTVSRSVESAA